MNRRAFLSSLLVPALCAGCGENTLGNNAIALIRGRIGPPAPKITRDYAAKLPYASMSARLGKKDAALLVLARAQQRDLVWRAGHDIVVLTRAGRILNTAGLPANIRQTWMRDPDPLARNPQLLSQPVQTLRVVDLQMPDGSFRTANLRARIAPAGRQTITIYGIEFDTVELVEEVEEPDAQWRFTNRFWVDAQNGFTWQSVQAIAPDFASLETQILKPAQQELQFLESKHA